MKWLVLKACYLAQQCRDWLEYKVLVPNLLMLLHQLWVLLYQETKLQILST
jgi:hypothetical protein